MTFGQNLYFMTSLEKFDKWFTEPLKKIEQTDPDAAYIVAGASFALFERFIDSRMRNEKHALSVRWMDGTQKKELFFTLPISVLAMTDLQPSRTFGICIGMASHIPFNR